MIGSTPGRHRTQTPFIGYKKVRCHNDNENYRFTAIATIEVPTDRLIIRSRPCYNDPYGATKKCYISDKLRTSEFKVLNIHDMKGNELSFDCNCFSGHDNSFKYKKGELHQPNKFNPSVSEECTNGLHFFQTKKEAEEYCL